MAAMDRDFEQRLETVLAREVDGYRALEACERLSAGANQETWRVVVEGTRGRQCYALRRAAGGAAVDPADAGPGLAVEALLMRAARAAGVPEPEVVYVLQSEDGLGDGFLMNWLDGETLGARIVRDDAYAAVRPRLARECGEILARIHAIDVVATGLDRHLETLSPRAFVERIRDRYHALDTPQPMIDYTVRWLLENLAPASATTLVHNDFRNGNLMIDRDGIVAVLDWELAHLGDPMRDLGWVCTNSWRFGRSELPVGGFGKREDLFAGYAAVAGREVDPDVVRWWEVFGSFWWAVGCLGMHDKYRRGLDATVERPAIARRSSECQADCVNLLIPGPYTLIEPVPSDDFGEMPHTDELLASVRAFLDGQVRSETAGRTRFFARVAAGSLDVVMRDAALGARHRDAELARLVSFLGVEGSLGALRWRLVEGLRDGSVDLGDRALTAHLRETVFNQLAIDQPGYSAFGGAY